jgi:hypothetical protein
MIEKKSTRRRRENEYHTSSNTHKNTCQTHIYTYVYTHIHTQKKEGKHTHTHTHTHRCTEYLPHYGGLLLELTEQFPTGLLLVEAFDSYALSVHDTFVHGTEPTFAQFVQDHQVLRSDLNQARETQLRANRVQLYHAVWIMTTPQVDHTIRSHLSAVFDGELMRAAGGQEYELCERTEHCSRKRARQRTAKTTTRTKARSRKAVMPRQGDRNRGRARAT